MVKLKNKENIQFRILYFIGIVLIVANHAGGGGISLFYEWFPAYSFHLALFVFCSGYFFIKNREEKVHKFILKLFKKFLIPLYFWNLIYGLILMMLHKIGINFGMPLNLKTLFIFPMYNGHQFMFNLSSWFIWPLFIIELVNIFILKLLKDRKINYYLYFILTLILGFIGVKLAMMWYNTGMLLLLCKVLYFLPFFSLGMLYKFDLESKDKLNNTIYFILLFAITLITIFIFKGTIEYVPSWCNNFDNVFRPFIVGILGILFWLRISKILVPFLKNNKFVMLMSRNTFSIMMHHLMGFFLLNSFYYFCFKVLRIINDFNYKVYASDIYYRYLPYGLTQFNILYVISGFAFSMLIIFIINKIKSIKS